MDLQKLSSREFKDIYIRRIASGETEHRILQSLQVEWIYFFELCARDPDFKNQIDNARKQRAEVWVHRIAESTQPRTDEFGIPDPIRAEEVPALKLEFDKLKFLAAADNPDRYSPNGKPPKVDVNINLADFKLLSPQESIKALNSDPFLKLATVDGVEVQTPNKEEDNGEEEEDS